MPAPLLWESFQQLGALPALAPVPSHRGSDRLAERGFKKGGVADDRAYTRGCRRREVKLSTQRLFARGGRSLKAHSRRHTLFPHAPLPRLFSTAGAIRGMRKMEFEELSEEQIQAARRRRQREVAKCARCRAARRAACRSGACPWPGLRAARAPAAGRAPAS